MLLAEWNCEIGKEVPEKWCNLITEIFESQEGKTEEEEVKDKIFSLTIASVKEAGYVNLYASDITDRKRIEKDLEKVKNRQK